LHGFGNIIPGLESALEGKRAGESLSVRITATDAYGERNEDLLQSVPRDMFEDNDSIQVGMQFQSGDPDGENRIVTVVSTDSDSITVDANHPLAGVPLNFAVTIVDVRDASGEELAHGHVHGAGGHHHE
jgi:FKBP-type peptidyl-prolyl cis-trans isomerase SlyD